MIKASAALTVIIPTYRRTASLLRTLASLQEQDASFEVLVMDNAADVVLRDAIEAFNQTARLPASWIPEPQPGVHFARNAGARHASAPLLAYTDDDVTFESGWARAYLEAFAVHEDMAAAGGPSHADWEGEPPAWLLSLVQLRPAFFQLSLRDMGPTFRLDETESFWSLNMAIRKDVLIANGGFHPELVGDDYVGDGEGGLFRKLRVSHQRIGYVPDALVHHHIQPSRMTMAYLLHRMCNEGASEAYASVRRTKQRPVRALLTILARNAVTAATFGAAALPLRWSNRSFPLRLRLLAAERAGRASYALRALGDADFRRMILRDDWI